MKSILKKLIPSKLMEDLVRAKQNKEVDRWRNAGMPAPMPHRVKQIAIEEYQSKFGLNTLVETGTYMGDMIFAMRKRFSKIYSIELGHDLWTQAVKRFETYNHITILNGDSGEKIEVVLNELMEPALFWLDGHYSEGVTAKGTLHTPIVAELKSVLKSGSYKHIVLIDDARCFNGENDYPTLSELTQLVQSLNQNYEIKLQYDIICITPKNNRI
jgi:hypothetical protein